MPLVPRLPFLLIALTLTLSAGAAPDKSASPPPLFPFVLPWDDDASGVTDLSAWHATPAGSRGFVRVIGDHLYIDGPAAEAPPQRIRFLGVNLSFAANFPTHDEAGRIAARLAKFGVNCVRLHHMDRDTAPKGLWEPDLKTFSATQLDRLDYLVAQLKARGIYLDLNLHVSRIYPDLPTWPGMPLFHKGVDNFFPRMIEMQKDYARDLLHHRNPYTGLRYIDEPAIAFVEINNENGLLGRWWSGRLDAMPALYADELAAQWRAWRLARDPADTPSAGIVLRRDYDALPADAQREWIDFLWETERAYWRGLRDFLKHDLGIRSPIIGTQLHAYSSPALQADMDVIDIHAYWEHPEFPGGPDDRDRWRVGNTSMVNSVDARTVADLALQAIAGKPLIVTEYNHSNPNTYGAETFPLIAAYAALQDWDAVFAYSYYHGMEPWDSGRFVGNFDIARHPVKMATLPHAAALFLRGDVATLAVVTETAASEAQFRDLTRRHGVNIGADHFGAARLDALRRPQRLHLGPPAATVVDTPPTPAYSGPIVSDGGRLIWDAAAPRGRFIADTPRSKAVIGFTDGETFDLGAVRVQVGTTRQGWSAILLSQMEGQALGAPGRILLTACGDIENTGMVWADESKSYVTAWGHAPTLVEGIAAHVELAAGDCEVRVWALDETGRRREPVPVVATSGNASVSFSIGAEFRTLWYEIEVSSGPRTSP